MAFMLQQRGFTTYTAATEQETVALAQKVKPQVVVTDNQKITRDAKGTLIVKDDLSGLSMTWDLCRIPELRETILIMFTADEVEPIFLWQGGDLFLSKNRRGGMQLAIVLEQYMR